MDIRTMQYYLSVVCKGTISAAAQALHVYQPSLSRQIKELGAELEAPLLCVSGWVSAGVSGDGSV